MSTGLLVLLAEGTRKEGGAEQLHPLFGPSNLGPRESGQPQGARQPSMRGSFLSSS